MKTLKRPVAWQECQFVSMANADRIAGRAEGWSRGAINAGQLQAARLPTGGPPVVYVASLRRLLQDVRPVTGTAPAEPGAHLRLVASNP